MSTNTSITNNTADACPPGLVAAVPDAWGFSNFTEMACAVPACNNFTDSLSSCCNGELNYFDTDSGAFASCSINSVDEKYIDYQRCLILESVFPFQCNNIHEATPDDCPDEIPQPDLRAGQRHQVCALRATPNATAALQECCTNGTEPDALTPYDHGCHVICQSDPDDRVLRDCLGARLGFDTDMRCFGAIKLEDEDENDGNPTEALRWSYGGILSVLLVVAGFLT